MQEKEKDKRIEFQGGKARKGFQGFPIWVWLVLLCVAGAVYLFLSMKY